MPCYAHIGSYGVVAFAKIVVHINFCQVRKPAGKILVVGQFFRIKFQIFQDYHVFGGNCPNLLLMLAVADVAGIKNYVRNLVVGQFLVGGNKLIIQQFGQPLGGRL